MEFTESMMTSVDKKLKDAIDRMAYFQDGQARVYGDMMSGTLDKEGYRQFSELFTKNIAKMDDEIKELQKLKFKKYEQYLQQSVSREEFMELQATVSEQIRQIEAQIRCLLCLRSAGGMAAGWYRGDV